jgi:enoyl-[acyl-carrier protein] reductase I
MPQLMEGKTALILGVANRWSLAYAIAQAFRREGGKLLLTYQGERQKETVSDLAAELGAVAVFDCDVTRDADLARLAETAREHAPVHAVVHSIAFANREDLAGNFSDTSREGFRLALEISAYSLLPLVKHAAPLMKNGGSVIAMTFQASQQVYPGYNVMDTAKAALEHEVRQLASEFGGQNIRVNAISAGPLDTLAARGIHGFLDMKRIHAEKAPLHRNITADEVAKTALFLCSDLSSGVTGTVIPVDAGYHIMAV